MTTKRLAALTIPRAPKGSKADWVPVTADVPPKLAERLILTARRLKKHKGDLVCDALAQYLDRAAA